MYHQMHTEGVILIGDVSMLFRYIQKMSGSFYGFAWQYSEVVRMHTDMKSVQPIIDDYNKIERRYTHDHTITSKSWSHIRIA